MASPARCNLLHDKVRLAVTLIGIVFAIVLVGVQVGLFMGFSATISGVIDHAGADIWITSKGMRDFDSAKPFAERKRYQVLATPGVAAASKCIVGFASWKRPDGGQESILIIGFDPDEAAGGPWNIVAGTLQDLKTADTVFVDELYRSKLGVTQLGQVVEINDWRARVAGFTRGIRTFTTSPYVFTWWKNAMNYQQLAADQTVYILVKAVPGVDLFELKQRLAARVAGVDIYTATEWSQKNRQYWLFATGAGVTILMSAALGLIVGTVVVAQTIYATTMDHLREFGTLKAMGASNGYIYRVIITQATISAVLGYIPGILICCMVARMSQKGGAVIILPWQMALGLFGLTLLMCILASMISINKVMRIDPAMVFKG
jgi:putative ABC transport system permease protein